MSMELAIHGRLTRDPQSKEGQNGTLTAWCSVATDLDCRDSDSGKETLFINIVCWNKVAERLLKHSKGDLISASGSAQLNIYQGEKQLGLKAESIISSRTVRPGGRPKQSQTTGTYQQPASYGPDPRAVKAQSDLYTPAPPTVTDMDDALPF